MVTGSERIQYNFMRITRLGDPSDIFLVIPNPGHDEIGDGGEEATCDNCKDIDHVDSLTARTTCGTILRRRNARIEQARCQMACEWQHRDPFAVST